MSRRYLVGVIVAGALLLGGWALAQPQPVAKTPAPESGRFAVSGAGDAAVLLDTRSGKTWVLSRSVVDGQALWIPAKRIDSEEPGGRASSRPGVAALLHVPMDSPQVLPGPKAQDISFDSFRRHQAALIKSTFVIAVALRDPKLAQLSIVRDRTDPLTWVAEQLQVDFPSPETMRVGLDGEKRQELATLLDGIVGAYLNEVVNRDRRQREERLGQLRRIYDQFDERLRNKRRALRELSQTFGMGETAELHRQLLVQDLEDYRRELRRVRLARAAAKADKEKNGGSPESSLAAQEKFLVQEVKDLERQLTQQHRDGLDIATMRADIKVLEAAAKRLMGELEKLEVESAAPPRVTLLETAVIRKGP